VSRSAKGKLIGVGELSTPSSAQAGGARADQESVVREKTYSIVKEGGTEEARESREDALFWGPRDPGTTLPCIQEAQRKNHRFKKQYRSVHNGNITKRRTPTLQGIRDRAGGEPREYSEAKTVSGKKS